MEALKLRSNICTVALVQWVNHLLPAYGGNSLRPGDVPTLTIKPGSPVSDVLLQW
jgi:hypothetical protein